MWKSLNYGGLFCFVVMKFIGLQIIGQNCKIGHVFSCCKWHITHKNMFQYADKTHSWRPATNKLFSSCADVKSNKGFAEMATTCTTQNRRSQQCASISQAIRHTSEPSASLSPPSHHPTPTPPPPFPGRTPHSHQPGGDSLSGPDVLMRTFVVLS